MENQDQKTRETFSSFEIGDVISFLHIVKTDPPILKHQCAHQQTESSTKLIPVDYLDTQNATNAVSKQELVDKPLILYPFPRPIKHLTVDICPFLFTIIPNNLEHFTSCHSLWGINHRIRSPSFPPWL